MQDVHSHAEEGHAHGGHGGQGGEEENINLRGAIVHVIGDLVQSLGVALAGALIWWKQARFILLLYEAYTLISTFLHHQDNSASIDPSLITMCTCSCMTC